MTKTTKIVVPVWGDTYLDTFLEYSLPAQLAARNIPAVAQHALKEYVIYTDREGKSRCECHAAIRRLAGLTPLRYEFLDSLEPFSAGANKIRVQERML